MIFGRTMFDQLLTLHGDKAAWKLIDQNPALVQETYFDLAPPEDINTWQDFERLEAAQESVKPA